jgi:ABC-type dipeptide/oligopeptide/nickel transport system permease component
MYTVYTYKSNWWGFIRKRVLIAVLGLFVITSISFSSYQIVDKYYTSLTSPNYGMGSSPMYFSDLPDERHHRVQGLPHIYSFFEKYDIWMKGFFTGDWGYSNTHFR